MPILKRQREEEKEQAVENLAVNFIKRKWTFDLSKNDEEMLMIENDEVSNKLLRKLTTPRPMARFMSFSYNDHYHFNLNLDSESDSYIDDLDPKSLCDLPSLNNFVGRNINDYM